MELLLDIGNSSINWAIEEQGAFSSTGFFSYKKTDFENDIQALASFNKPDNILVSNVAGVPILNLLNNWTQQNWQLQCRQPKVSKQFKELKNSYYDPEQMGLDRWLAMIAAWENFQTAICLVGCGTAMTIDLIDENGNHLGGYIVPGVELMQKTLVNNTEQIDITLKNISSLECANDTQAAVTNGTFLATVAMIDRVVDKFVEQSNTEVKCIMSGGMANSINQLLTKTFKYEPDLVLKGLSILNKAHQ
jgi:type III pantothenate kinase